jgi:hypothetical protein
MNQENMKCQPATILPANKSEVVDVLLSKEKTPFVYEMKKKDFMDSGLSEQEAEKMLEITPIQLELVYSYEHGLWAIESEALESINPFCPYTGTEIENPEND